ncbi:glycosyltransferase [Flavobacteriales bacterium]|nr:glycosyltransferase [Flavobacteriales bacterium]
MILFIGHDASLTGAPKSLLLIIEFIKSKYSGPIEIILGNSGPLLDDYQKLGRVHVWNKKWYWEQNILKRIKNRFIDSNFRRQKSITNYFLNNTPKLIFNNTIVNGQILSKLAFLNIKTISRIPEMQTVMQLYETQFDNSSSKVLKNTNLFISPSNAAKNNLVNNFSVDPDKVHVCYGHVKKPEVVKGKELSILRDKLKLPKSAFIVGGCGTLGWRKGSDLFLQVASYLKNNQDIYFMWLGVDEKNGSYHEFVYEAEKFGVLEKTLLIPYDLKINKYYQLMNVFLMTSREDPFPLVNLEAASFGVPIICFDKSGGSNELVDENSGFIVPYGDSKEMSEKVKELKSNNALRKKLSEGILKKNNQFNNDIEIKKMFNIISEYI